MVRWGLFFLCIFIGLGLGLLYGWYINPVKYFDTTPDTLRIDYKTDYVLMVAEAYRAENDINQAFRRLAILGSAFPPKMVDESIRFAEREGYSDPDLALMRSLYSAVQSYQPNQGTLLP